MGKDQTSPTIADLIRARFNEFKPAERKIANYLLGNYPMAGLTTITELSAACQVSTPTVMRTLGRIGFTSFTSFQKALKKELAETLSDPVAKHGLWATGTPREHILNRAAEMVVANLRDTINHVSYDSFNQVVELVADEKRMLHLVGGRITHAFSDYLGTHLEVIRRGVRQLPASAGLWPHHLLDMEAGDLLLMFDVRRYEMDLVDLARMAVDKGVVVVLFTDQWLSPIADYASHSFPAHIEAASGWDSGVAILFLIEALITAVESRLWPAASERMNELERTFDRTGRFRQGKG